LTSGEWIAESEHEQGTRKTSKAGHRAVCRRRDPHFWRLPRPLGRGGSSNRFPGAVSPPDLADAGGEWGDNRSRIRRRHWQENIWWTLGQADRP
jgi:hypothetical protein